jgi:hypothetical protein
MSTSHILNLLLAERDRIQAAINALKTAPVSEPPEWVTGSEPTKRPRKKRKMSAAARKRIGEATRARWAAKRAASKKKA